MLDAVTQYLLAITPAVTAVVGIITVFGVSIGKIKKANRDATKEIKEIHQENVELRRELRETMKENREIKQTLKKITAKMEHMYFVDEEK